MLIELSTQPAAHQVGAKASRLGWLLARGWPVPPGFVVPFEVTSDLAGCQDDLRSALAATLDPEVRYVVRSSANVEDQVRRSFAGQFSSVSDVAGIDDVLDAVRAVSTSGRSEQVRAYARHAGIDPDGLRVAVIVQQWVPAEVSGVAFSRDPVTGVDRAVLEAVPGRSDQLLAHGATPQRWVGTDRGVLEGPADPVLPVGEPDRILDMVRGIARASGEPADVEWVWAARGLHLVQWRPITALADPPRVWSSRMARDMLPGLIPPLVWSVNVPVLSQVWTGLVQEALGDVGVDPHELVRAFGYRAYFNTSALGDVFAALGMPRDALERMRAGTDRSSVRPSARAMVARGPRLARFGVTLMTWQRRAEGPLELVEAQRVVEEASDPADLADVELVARVDRLRELLARAARLNIVTPLLADAWASSVRRSVPSGNGAAAPDPGQEHPAVLALDPAHALARLADDDEAGWERFLATFGHLSDSPNDCSRPTWAEQPDHVRRLAGASADRLAPRGGGADPRTTLLAGIPAWRRPLVALRWDRAARYRLARERVGYGYARAYALFRPTFLELGRRLRDRGTLAAEQDVFLLTWAEARGALLDGAGDLSGVTAERQAEMAEASALDWPETIVGDDPVPIRGRASARLLRGLPTSAGRHTGPARVVTSLAGVGQVDRSDVLVLPAADVTWTPLLLRAGAVVTETGGMLSHASIVARELGLPCVASVAGAIGIPAGTMVCVDGTVGEVLLLGDAEAAAPPAGPAPPQS